MATAAATPTKPAAGMRYLPIGELADKARVRASALRYWEERGLLPGARREGGRRVWPASTVRRSPSSKWPSEQGFTLAEITQLLTNDTTPSATRQWRDMARANCPNPTGTSRRPRPCGRQ